MIYVTNRWTGFYIMETKHFVDGFVTQQLDTFSNITLEIIDQSAELVQSCQRSDAVRVILMSLLNKFSIFIVDSGHLIMC